MFFNIYITIYYKKHRIILKGSTKRFLSYGTSLDSQYFERSVYISKIEDSNK